MVGRLSRERRLIRSPGATTATHRVAARLDPEEPAMRLDLRIDIKVDVAKCLTAIFGFIILLM
jgi:hypothetical protein